MRALPLGGARVAMGVLLFLVVRRRNP
jgi:hypothetical protein